MVKVSLFYTGQWLAIGGGMGLVLYLPNLKLFNILVVQWGYGPSAVLAKLETLQHSCGTMLYTLRMTSYGVACPLGQLGSAVLAVPPPKTLCTPRLLTGGMD
ncbi:hypothetical protein HGM15179_010268 [Zosterops borbonicus]|uniref:Uncharacterized protein n=1 Tax=Zosterops borbonicus TaxID=364589 RepID=A0A8K1GF37_9PASS|nr:hypothetical protein HGM15179_010268 [Zosterops borbonicus]